MNLHEARPTQVHKWRHPSNIWIAGPTQSGKTRFTQKLLRHRKHLFDPPVKSVVFVYSTWQKTYDEIKREDPTVMWIQGLPDDPFKYFEKGGNGLLVLDDAMSEMRDRAEHVSRWFTRGSHHKNVSIACLVQNLFPKHFREISLNAHILVLFNNPRDKSQIVRFVGQAFPGQTRRIQTALTVAHSRPYRPLVINMHQTTPDALSLTMDIFPEDLKTSKEPFPQILLPSS